MTDLLKFCDSADLLSERVLTPIAAAPPDPPAAPTGAAAGRRDEIAAAIDACASRLGRLGLSATEAANLLQHRMAQAGPTV